MRDDAALDGTRDYLLYVDAFAVIAHLDDYLVPLVVGVEAQRTLCRLASRNTISRQFDAMIHRVADQMRHGFCEHVEDALIKVRFLSANCKPDFFPARLRYVAHDAWEAAEQMLHRHHADLHH